MSYHNNRTQASMAPDLLNSLPCYSHRDSEWLQAPTGPHVVEKSDESAYNLRNKIPFDCNWGRGYYTDSLPLGRAGENTGTFISPACVQLPSDYVPLAYVLNPWDVRSATFQEQLGFQENK